MPATQMNTRIDCELKTLGDMVLKQAGMSPSQAVRCLWQEMADTGKIPEFMQGSHKKAPSSKQVKKWSASGAGLALSLAKEENLVFDDAGLDAMSFADLKEAAFEEILLEGKMTHV